MYAGDYNRPREQCRMIVTSAERDRRIDRECSLTRPFQTLSCCSVHRLGSDATSRAHLMASHVSPYSPPQSSLAPEALIGIGLLKIDGRSRSTITDAAQSRSF